MNDKLSNININVIGVMSGTSLDGVDICCVDFIYDKTAWTYKIIAAENKSYPDKLRNKIANAHLTDANSFAVLHSNFGLYIGEQINFFINKYSLKPDLIASHGHTIFHQTEKRLTFQIGSGAGIAAETGINTVCDFRSTDVALNGQGAPLVPIGDHFLFSEYEYCLNLGGFSNISFQKDDHRIAFDVCPVNFVINHYMKNEGKEFDNNGEKARSGKVNQQLLNDLNELNVYKFSGPKSLAREDVEEMFFPVIDSYQITLEDKLATYTEHISTQISKSIIFGKVLVTGGGAFNRFLIERMRVNSPQCDYHIPDPQIINFKEALIFALLGVLYLYDVPNCLASVTGARYDNIGGALYKSIKK
jgi:anhydro-N-acetylmuramic acid kinase